MSATPISAPPQARRAGGQQSLQREALLDAACELIQTRRWSEIPLADVARLAGVNRGVIYRQFGSRSALTRALAARETWRLTDSVERVLAENRTSPVDALRAAFDVLTAVSERALLAALILGPPARPSAPPHLGGAAPLENAASRLAGLILNTWPSIEPADADLLSDTLARLAVSYHRLPTSSPAVSPGSLTVVLAAFLEHRLTDRGHP